MNLLATPKRNEDSESMRSSFPSPNQLDSFDRIDNIKLPLKVREPREHNLSSTFDRASSIDFESQQTPISHLAPNEFHQACQKLLDQEDEISEAESFREDSEFSRQIDQADIIQPNWEVPIECYAPESQD
jgi:hypothetical protein